MTDTPARQAIYLMVAGGFSFILRLKQLVACAVAEQPI
jgi:hypothetical protein